MFFEPPDDDPGYTTAVVLLAKTHELLSYSVQCWFVYRRGEGLTDSKPSHPDSFSLTIQQWKTKLSSVQAQVIQRECLVSRHA